MKMFYLDRPKTRYTFEPIEGCSFGCEYCNAFIGSNDIKNWNDWIKPTIHNINPIKIVDEFEKLNKKLPIMLDFVFVCSTSDPFQSKETESVIYKTLDVLHNQLGLNTRLLTKGFIPSWLSKFHNNMIGITIDSIERLERFEKNGDIKSLEKLTEKGIYTNISLQPFDLSVNKKLFISVLEKIRFVKQINFGILDDAPKEDFHKGFLLADIVANFCLKHKINYFNGSPRFNRESKKRLLKMNIKRPIWFGDNIDSTLYGIMYKERVCR